MGARWRHLGRPSGITDGVEAVNAVSAYYVHPRIDHRGPVVCPGVFIAGLFGEEKLGTGCPSVRQWAARLLGVWGLRCGGLDE